MKLSELLGDVALRRRLAEEGIKLVADRFLLETNAWRWMNAWEQARENRRRY